LCRHLLWRLLRFLLRRWLLLSQAGGGLFGSLLAKFLDAVENSPHDRLRIKPVNFLMDCPLGVMDGSVRERSTSNILHAMLRIPGAVEVVDAEAPLALMLEHVHHLLQVPAVHAIRRKVLDYLEGRLVIQHQLRKL
jgi:hypothetical protein